MKGLKTRTKTKHSTLFNRNKGDRGILGMLHKRMIEEKRSNKCNTR